MQTNWLNAAITLKWQELTPQQYAAVIAALFLVIGGIDVITGVEIRIFPLYFIPLVAATWHYGYHGAISGSVGATVTWLAAQYLSGENYSYSWIWLVNFLTQGTAFVAGSLVVARLRNALRTEKALSRTDLLTGLANRRAFYEQANTVLQLCKRNKKPVTLVFLDLDHFKELNDTRGHDGGDEFLRQVAGTLNGSLRGSDIVARFGGDEFAILFPETGEADAAIVMEKVRQKLAAIAEAVQCNVTASIGGICYNLADCDVDDMVGTADQLMYKVKGSTKDRVHIVNATALDRLLEDDAIPPGS